MTYSSCDISYKFVDTDNNMQYDTVFVINEQSFVIGSIDITRNKIFRDLVNPNAMTTYLNAYITLDQTVDWSLKDTLGNNLTISDLKVGQVCNIRESFDGVNRFYEIIITDKKVSGIVEEMYQENNKVGTGVTTYYVINGTAYETVGFTSLILGDNITTTLNNQGEIISYIVDTSMLKYGVVTAIAVDIIFAPVAQVQLMTQTGEIEVLKLARNINVNGVYKTTSIDFDTITELNAVLPQGKLFVYELNSANEIKAVYTTTEGLQSRDNEMSFVSFSSYSYVESVGKLGSNYITDNSLVYAIKTAVLTDKSDLIIGYKSILVDEDSYTGTAITNSNNEIQAVVLFYAGNNVKADSFPMVITSVATSSFDGNLRTKLKGFVNGEVVEYLGEEDCNLSALEANDVIQFALNGNKEISNYSIIANYLSTGFVVADNGNLGGNAYDDSKDEVAGKFVTLGLNDTYTVSATPTTALKGFSAAGKVYEAIGSTLRLISVPYGQVCDIYGNKNYGSNIKDIFINPNTVAYIYNGVTKKIQPTTIANLETDKNTVDYATTGRDNDDLVYVYNYDGETYMILIIDTIGDN